jgi:hypothetical protein
MPTVPKYQQQTELRGLPSVQQQSIASPELLGAGARQTQEAGNALLRAGAGLSNIAADMQQREDADMVFQAEAAFRESLIGFEQEALTRTGNKAWGITKDVDKWFQDSGAKFAEGLTNDRQRALFNQQVGKMRLQGLESFSKFESQQRVKSLEQSTNATLETLINSAATTAQMMNSEEFSTAGTTQTGPDGQPVPGPLSALQSMKQDGLRRLEFYAADTGEDSSVTDLKKQLYTSKFHKQVIQARIDADPSSAKAYYEANKEEIAGAERLNLEELVRTGEMKVKAQSFVDAAISDGLSQLDAMQLARDSFMGEDRNAVMDEITTVFGKLNQAREADQRQAADEAWSYVADGKSPPLVLMQALDGRDRAAIKKTLSEGPPKKTNINKWLEFTNMTPQQLAQMEPNILLRDYRAHFSDADIRNANEMIQAAKGKGTAEGLQLMTATDLVKSAARQIGVLPKSGDRVTPTQEEDFNQFRDAMQLKVRAWEVTNGKKANAEVVNDLLNKEKLNKVYLDVWGIDPQRPAIALTPEQQAQAYVVSGKREIRLTTISADYRADAIRRIQARGLPVTEQQIAEMWAADNPGK